MVNHQPPVGLCRVMVSISAEEQLFGHHLQSSLMAVEICQETALCMGKSDMPKPLSQTAGGFQGQQPSRSFALITMGKR